MFRMSRILMTVALISAAGLAVWPQHSGAADDPANIIKYRQNVMRASASHITGIFSVLKGETSFTKHIAAHARAISNIAVMVPDMFPTDSSEGDTAALPSIWLDWTKFEVAAAAMKIAADKVAVAADAGDMATVSTGAGEIGKACGGCHEPFRKKR